MAIANVSPPLFLLLDILLASSWTWLALLLATIATTLRALRLRFSRRRLLTLAAETLVAAANAPISSFPDASPCADDSSSPSSLHRSFKRRAGCKSSPSLEKLLHRNRDDFWLSGVDFLSSAFDTEALPSLKRISSASKIFHGQHACAESPQKPGLCAKLATAKASIDKDCLDSAKQVLDSDKAAGLGLGLKFEYETLAMENEVPCQSSSMENQVCEDEDDLSCRWLPSWAFSLGSPSQLRRPSSSRAADHHGSPPQSDSPCFEKQFGWDKLLENKLGFPRILPSGILSGFKWQSECTMMGNGDVVKMWDDQPKKVLRKLYLDEQSTLALDACVPEGLACTSNIGGEISMWDLERRACTRASTTFAHPVLALSMNVEQSTTVVGSVASIGLWDQRSPSCNLNFARMPSTSLSGLKSRENGLCVATDNGILSMYDLRKLHDGPFVSGVAPKRHQNLLMSDDESTLWEKFMWDVEEDIEAECDLDAEGRAIESHKGGSLVSRFTTFVRAITFMW